MALNAKDLKKLMREVTEAILSDENYISTLVKTVLEQVSKKVNEIFNSHEEKFEEYEKRIRVLEQDNKKLCDRLNNQEQDLKSNCIRIFGIEESPDENVEDLLQNLFSKNLKVKLNTTDIEKCFRIGRQTRQSDKVQRSGTKTNMKTRAVFVKFASYKDKQEIMKNKKLLKSSGVVIREELTQVKLALVKKAVQKFMSRNVWTNDGRIFAISGGKKIAINSELDLE